MRTVLCGWYHVPWSAPPTGPLSPFSSSSPPSPSTPPCGCLSGLCPNQGQPGQQAGWVGPNSGHTQPPPDLSNRDSQLSITGSLTPSQTHDCHPGLCYNLDHVMQLIPAVPHNGSGDAQQGLSVPLGSSRSWHLSPNTSVIEVLYFFFTLSLR